MQVQVYIKDTYPSAIAQVTVDEHEPDMRTEAINKATLQALRTAMASLEDQIKKYENMQSAYKNGSVVIGSNGVIVNGMPISQYTINNNVLYYHDVYYPSPTYPVSYVSKI